MGSTTSGIDGLHLDGNTKGQRLTVRGRLGFALVDGKWQADTFIPVQVDNKTAVVKTLDTPSPDSIIKNVRVLLAHDSESTRSAKDKITINELQRSLARIDLGHAEIDDYHTIGTGWPTGSYYRFGEAFTRYANEQGFKIYNYASEGSLENGYRVNLGGIDFAILQSDVAEVLYNGWIEEGQLPSPDMRAIASL